MNPDNYFWNHIIMLSYKDQPSIHMKKVNLLTNTALQNPIHRNAGKTKSGFKNVQIPVEAGAL